MDGPVVLALAGILLAIAAAGLAVWLGTRSDMQVSATRQDMHLALAAQTQAMTTAISAQLGQISQGVAQELGLVRQQLQSGVASSGQMMGMAQVAMAKELKHSQEILTRINQQLGEVQEGGRNLSQAAQTLQMVLSGTKTRGSLGEITLERLLEDALPRSAYEVQFRFGNGSVVDAIVRSGERLLPIDSKFPLEAYRRMAEGGEGADTARREFTQAVRKHADAIAEKYILPEEHTLDFALMFVPSEGVYYELLMAEDTKGGRLDEYCRAKRVLPVSPNTCYAYLCTVALSHKGLRLEENVRQIQECLEGLRKELGNFSEAYNKLGGHLRNASKTYEDADNKLARARSSLEQMCDGLPEAKAPTASPVDPVALPAGRPAETN